MKKIIVAGVSAGAGKSTFAKNLADRLHIPVHHLDSFYWKPGWIERNPEEFREAQQQLVQGDAWIIEGNYASTMEIRLAEADTFIYLELPLRICIYRVLKRWLQNYGKTRPDMAAGCAEKMDKEFLKFIVTTYAARKQAMRQRAIEFQASGPNRKSIVLQSQKQIDGFFK